MPDCEVPANFNSENADPEKKKFGNHWVNTCQISLSFSITIDDIVYVIDCGKIKMKNFEPDKNLTSLEPQMVSKANSRQRRGRSGR